MKKLILAALLYAAAMGVASAATAVPASDSGAQRGIDPFGVPVYVRGGFNDWGLANPMTYDSGSSTYNAVISLDVGIWEFKVASEDWSAVDLGNIDQVGTFSPPATVNVGRTAFGNLSIEILTSGLYSFSLDVSALRGTDGPYPLTVQAIPVPAAGLLLLSALGGLGFLRRR